MCRRAPRSAVVVQPASTTTQLPPAYSPVDHHTSAPGLVSSRIQLATDDKVSHLEPDLNTTIDPEDLQRYKENMQQTFVEDEFEPSAPPPAARSLPGYTQSTAAAASPPNTYGPIPSALLRSISNFAAGRGWEQPPNWEPGHPNPGPLDLLVQAGKMAKAHHDRSRRGCRRRRACGCGQQADGRGVARVDAGGDVFPEEVLQQDLHAFNAAMVDVRAGTCCSKGAAKRAVRNLKMDLMEIEARRNGGRLDRAGRKELKAEVKEVVKEFKREIKEAWRAAP
jgi:hypothetical protein